MEKSSSNQISESHKKGLESGLKGEGVSDPIIDFRADDEKKAEIRGNEKGQAIKAEHDLEKEDADESKEDDD